MIIAAAIKFYIEKTDQEVILCGLRHDSVFKQLKALGFEPKKGYKELEQGFLTSDGKFLNREQAYYHALGCKQIKSDDEPAWLFSEMLW
ncbi:MAG TPA: hypothetical protein DCW90_07540 [Lachnospiraceae bacterium]|nr:hypothetical protein [Lachnospiraceae bacterium]